MTFAGSSQRLGVIRLVSAAVTIAVSMAWAGMSKADIVNDTWRDTTRSDPLWSNGYAENSGDVDGDGNIESAWFRTGDGTMTVVAPSGGAAVNGSDNVLRKTLTAGAASSATWTTYFTSRQVPATLANAGDSMTVKWVFTPTGVNTTNGSQNFRIALINSPAASRLTAADGAPGSAAYLGYAMFLNFGQTTGRTTPFQLLERNVASGDTLGTSGNWLAIANAPGFGTGAKGYFDGVQYTFTMSLTHNALDGLDIVATMAGGTGLQLINGTGSVSVSFTDPTPSTFTYDTFQLRPSGATTTASQFDTSLFQVTGVPEASSFVMIGLVGAGGLVVRRIRRRSAV